MSRFSTLKTGRISEKNKNTVLVAPETVLAAVFKVLFPFVHKLFNPHVLTRGMGGGKLTLALGEMEC